MKSDIYNKKEWLDKFIFSESHTPYYQEKRKKILSAIPPGVKSVLDIGIGEGFTVRAIRQKGLKCVGIDIAKEAIERAKEHSSSVLVANIRNLPFKDNEFDLVIAADLVEHISSDRRIFEESIAQLKKVAKEYILCISPYKEQINWPVSLCNSCNKEFNVYGHNRSIDLKMIKRIFPEKECEILKLEPFGVKRDFRPSLLVNLGRRFGWLYSEEAAVCPFCGNSHIELPQKSFPRKIIGKLIWGTFLLMDRFTPEYVKESSEVFVFLKKNVVGAEDEKQQI